MGGVFDQAVGHRMACINALRRAAATASDARWRVKLLLDLEAERRSLARPLAFARSAVSMTA